MSAEGIAFVHDYRPDRADYRGYGAVEESFVGPILPHLTVPVRRVAEPIDGWLNVRWYTWPQPQEHVFISHGIADKNYRTPAKVYGFRWIHTSGPWWTDYYKRFGEEGIGKRLIETGYTKLDPLFDGTIDRVPRPPGARVRVLWAPTHAGINGHSHNYPSSYIELRKAIATLLPEREFDVTIAPHPRLREQAGLPIKVTLEEYASADVVIADAGSTLYEAWALGIPVVLPEWIVGRKVKSRSDRTLETLIYREKIAHNATSAGDLAKVTARAAIDGMSERAIELAEAILPAAYRGSSGKRTAEALSALSLGPVPRITPSNFFWIMSEDGTRYEHVLAKQYEAIYKHKGWRRASPPAEVPEA